MTTTTTQITSADLTCCLLTATEIPIENVVPTAFPWKSTDFLWAKHTGHIVRLSVRHRASNIQSQISHVSSNVSWIPCATNNRSLRNTWWKLKITRTFSFFLIFLCFSETGDKTCQLPKEIPWNFFTTQPKNQKRANWREWKRNRIRNRIRTKIIPAPLKEPRSLKPQRILDCDHHSLLGIPANWATTWYSHLLLPTTGCLSRKEWRFSMTWWWHLTTRPLPPMEKQNSPAILSLVPLVLQLLRSLSTIGPRPAIPRIFLTAWRCLITRLSCIFWLK